MTPRQKSPVALGLQLPTGKVCIVAIDQATALSLATHATSDPGAYAAGLIMRACKTAAAIGVKPHEVATEAAAAVIYRGARSV